MPFFQLDAGLLDLVQGIPVGHQLRERELVLAHPVQEDREVGCLSAIGAAAIAGADPLIRTGIGDVDFLDYQRPAKFNLDGGFSFHDRLP